MKQDLKYIILGHMRSGSSVLNESLELHPDLNVAYEIFQPSAKIELTNIPNIRDIMYELYSFRNWSKVKYSNIYCRFKHHPDDRIFKKITDQHEIIAENVNLGKFIDRVFTEYNGFKLLYNHLNRNYKVWDHLQNIPNLKIIHIYRENYLESLVSLYLSLSSQIWQRRNWEKIIEADVFYLDPKIAEEYFFGMDFQIEHFTSMFCKNSIKIEYQEIISDWNKVLSKICHFLEIKKYNLQPKYIKRNVLKPRKLITNYQELYYHFKNTKWENQFDKPIKI